MLLVVSQKCQIVRRTRGPLPLNTTRKTSRLRPRNHQMKPLKTGLNLAVLLLGARSLSSLDRNQQNSFVLCKFDNKAIKKNSPRSQLEAVEAAASALSLYQKEQILPHCPWSVLMCFRNTLGTRLVLMTGYDRKEEKSLSVPSLCVTSKFSKSVLPSFAASLRSLNFVTPLSIEYVFCTL